MIKRKMAEKDYNSKIEERAQAKKRIHFESIDSTNNWAKAHSDQWTPEGITLITAAEQTGGRGRFKRRWESPRDVNIYATYCFWIGHGFQEIGHIPQLLALAAAKTLEQERFCCKIKWPNDVLINNKKIAGILCETIVVDDKRGVVCGIGMNVNMAPEDLNRIDRPATSLLAETGREWEVSAILERMSTLFGECLEKFFEEGFISFFKEFQERSPYKKGDAVRFHDNINIVEGWFERLYRDGSVELILRNGSKKKFYAGEFVERGAES